MASLITPLWRFQVGSISVGVTVFDSVGLKGTTTFQVTVKDVTPPICTCPSDYYVSGNVGNYSTVLFNYPTAYDVVDGNLTTNVTCSRAATNTSFFAGSYEIIYCQAKDSSGNTGVCLFTVFVDDFTGAKIIW